MASRFRRGSATDKTLVQDDVRRGAPVVEEEWEEPPPPPPRGRPPTLWPWLLLLLLLVAAGLIALWLGRRDNDHTGSGNIRVANVVGMKQGPAVARLNRDGLTPRVVAKPSSRPAGTVFGEAPAPGARVARGTVITLSTSATAQVTVPDVVGDKAAAAIRTLRSEGLSAQPSSVARSEEHTSELQS